MDDYSDISALLNRDGGIWIFVDEDGDQKYLTSRDATAAGGVDKWAVLMATIRQQQVSYSWCSIPVGVSPAIEFDVGYCEYIRSSAWRTKASVAKERASWRCQLCNEHKDNVQLHAHHRTYERLGHERIEDITVLCADCHAKFHNKD